MTPKQDYRQTNQTPHNDDMWNYLIFGAVLFLVLMLTIKLLAYVAKFFYFAILFPFYIARGIHPLVEIFLALVVGVGLVVAWYYRKYIKNIEDVSFILPIYAILLICFTIVEISGLPLLTGFMDVYCVPTIQIHSEQSNVLTAAMAIFNCTMQLQDLMNVGMLNIVIFALVPNTLLCLWANYRVYSSFPRISEEHPKAAMQEKLTMEKLIRSKANQQPHLKFYEKIDLNTLPLYFGRLRKLDNSKLFMYKHDLIDEFVPRSQAKYFGRKYSEKETEYLEGALPDTDDLVPQINEQKFNHLLLEQLGLPFIDVDSLTPIQTILLSITIPRACLIDTLLDKKENTDPQKQPKTVEMMVKKRISELWEYVYQDLKSQNGRGIHFLDIESINSSWKSQNFSDFQGLDECREVLKFWINESYVAQELIAEHGYINTLLMASLGYKKGARRLGVLAPADFRWLKLYDRSLWAIIQNTDRTAFFAENMATSSHYYAELLAGKKIMEPMFQAAYDGFVKEVQSYAYEHKHIEAWRKYHKGEPEGIELMKRYSLIY